MRTHAFLTIACALSALLAGSASFAQDAGTGPVFSFSGDFRLRVEQDRDSSDASGVLRDDRLRSRIRARVQLLARPTDGVELGLRARTGHRDSHQSSHITIADFDGGPEGDFEVNLDRWYGRWSGGNASVWLGRDGLPLWKQNEMFWDDDVTAAGLGATYRLTVSDATHIDLNAGYFALPVGMREFSGSMALGQAVLTTQAGGMPLVLAAGVLAIEADGNDPAAARLLSGNGMRDYTLFLASAQMRFETGLGPFRLGLDISENLEDYSAADPDPVTAANAGETSAYVFSAQWGEQTAPGDWTAGYYYAHVERLAVHASYAQDDWMRWGSAVETRSSDYEGHEFRLTYALTDRIGLVGRVYHAESITTVEDGSRARLDLNVKF